MFGWQKRLYETHRGIKLTEVLAKKDYDVQLYEAKNLMWLQKLIHLTISAQKRQKLTWNSDALKIMLKLIVAK